MTGWNLGTLGPESVLIIRNAGTVGDLPLVLVWDSSSFAGDCSY
ncbi:MAG: hypothetical protein RJA35_598 [Actinomycetota bacterium]|jgi:hypothetical protein